MKVWVHKRNLKSIQDDEHNVCQWLKIFKYKPVYNDAVEIEIRETGSKQ